MKPAPFTWPLAGCPVDGSRHCGCVASKGPPRRPGETGRTRHIWRHRGRSRIEPRSCDLAHGSMCGVADLTGIRAELIPELEAEEDARFVAERPRSMELLERARGSMPRGVPMV